MQVKTPTIILELTEFEAKTIAFALHEYIWAQARSYKEDYPDNNWEDFKKLKEPHDFESNDLLEMWGKLAKFWKKEDVNSFEKLIKEKVFEG